MIQAGWIDKTDEVVCNEGNKSEPQEACNALTDGKCLHTNVVDKAAEQATQQQVKAFPRTTVRLESGSGQEDMQAFA